MSHEIEKDTAAKEFSVSNKLKTGVLAMADLALPLAPMEKRIEGFPQELRAYLRLWRARVGYSGHIALDAYVIGNFANTGHIDPLLLVSNPLAFLALVKFNSVRKLNRLVYSNLDRQMAKKAKTSLFKVFKN